MEPTSFTSTTIVNESNLNTKRYKKQFNGKITQLTLLGATSPDIGYPDLVYAVSRNKDDAKVTNILQMASAILSSSKVLFMGMLRKMMSLLDPALAQLCYCG